MSFMFERQSCFPSALFLYLFFSFYVVCVYSENVDDNDPPQTATTKKLFSMQKYNDIWLTASKKLSEKKLYQLQKVLRKFDRTELELKHVDDKQAKDSVRDHLNEVLKEFGLLEDAVKTLDHRDIGFEDERINSLWHDAVDGGHFSKEELHKLYKEILHMQTRLKKQRTYAEKASDYQKFVYQQMENDARVLDNHVEPTEDENAPLKQDNDLDMMLKENEKELLEGISEIEMKVQNQGNLKKEEQFTDHRVVELWDNVRRSANFSDSEVVSIREELSHFQTHIDKLHHWERHGEELGKREVDNNLSKEYRETKTKIKEYQKKVKKYHATMKKKVKMMKSEL